MNNIDEIGLAKLNTDSLINIILKLKTEYDIKINRMTKYRDNCLKYSIQLNEHILEELGYQMIGPCEECGEPLKKWEDEAGEIYDSYVCDNCDSLICEKCVCVKECGDTRNILWCSDCMKNE